MEQDDMASENQRDEREASEREQPKDSRSPTPLPQVNPPLSNDGPELPRSSDC
jgi:hypothetical protein